MAMNVTFITESGTKWHLFGTLFIPIFKSFKLLFYLCPSTTWLIHFSVWRLLFAEGKAFRYEGKFIPNGKINKACDYLLSRQNYFENFLNHLELRNGNNVCERNIRPLTIGRKDWLFAGSEKGGDSITIVSSLIQTCRNLQINPREYLEFALRKINNTPEEKLDNLLHKTTKNWNKLYKNYTQLTVTLVIMAFLIIRIAL